MKEGLYGNTITKTCKEQLIKHNFYRVISFDWNLVVTIDAFWIQHGLGSRAIMT